jgi:hypothetical protein
MQSTARLLRRLPVTLWAAVSCTVASPAFADLFDSEEPLAIKLAGPLSAVFRDRDDPEYQDAELTYLDSVRGEVAVPLRVRVRGKSRAELCDVPPLRLNFRRKDLADTVFAGENNLKLVTHCETSATYDQYLLLEYLTYRVFNLLTATSLRARPVTVNYFDVVRERDLDTRPGILIEDEERFAERQGFTAFEAPSVERARYDPEALMLLDVFEYLIGNTDWSAVAGPAGAVCCHNVVPYARADGILVPIPYDFDSAGLVNAPHALPNERLPIRDVRTRLYRGRCRTPAELAPTFARFDEQRAAILALFDERQGLSADVAARTREYLEDFYAVLADPERKEKAFFDCDR